MGEIRDLVKVMSSVEGESLDEECCTRIAEPLSRSTEENIDESSTFLFVDEDEEHSTQEKENVHGSLISALSNLSIQYNLGVIAPALLLLDPSRCECPDK
jgi:hypothetical protein